MVSAKIIADSICLSEEFRVTTMEVTMHRFVLAEFNTHRVFSRNSASSRAIPIKKRIASVLEQPAMPVWWGKNQAGMQAREELQGQDRVNAVNVWLQARDAMVDFARQLDEAGLHKQLTNRLLEPWLYTTVVVTSTEWENFFKQRCHPDAQPEMMMPAKEMQFAYNHSTPKLLLMDDWHMPYVTDAELSQYGQVACLKASVARCARVSTLHHDGTRNIQKDFELYEKLRNHRPPHASPFEHVCTPLALHDVEHAPGNLDGWIQLRHIVMPPNRKNAVAWRDWSEYKPLEDPELGGLL